MMKPFEMSTGDLILCVNLLEAEAKRSPTYAEDRKALANRMRAEVDKRDRERSQG